MTFKNLSKEDSELYKIDHKVRMKLGLPINKISNSIPFGYKEDNEDSNLLIPIYKYLQLIYEASNLVKEHTKSSVVKWLNSECERSKISIPGFDLILKTRLPDSRITLPLKERYKVYDELKGRF